MKTLEESSPSGGKGFDVWDAILGVIVEPRRTMRRFADEGVPLRWGFFALLVTSIISSLSGLPFLGSTFRDLGLGEVTGAFLGVLGVLGVVFSILSWFLSAAVVHMTAVLLGGREGEHDTDRARTLPVQSPRPMEDRPVDTMEAASGAPSLEGSEDMEGLEGRSITLPLPDSAQPRKKVYYSSARSLLTMTAFAQVPQVFNAPASLLSRLIGVWAGVVAGLVVTVWVIVLTVMAVAENYGFSGGRAALTVFLPAVVMLAVVFALVLVFALSLVPAVMTPGAVPVPGL